MSQLQIINMLSTTDNRTPSKISFFHFGPVEMGETLRNPVKAERKADERELTEEELSSSEVSASSF